MNDDDLDTMVRCAAHPVPTTTALDRAEQQLLEGIVSTPRHAGRAVTLTVLAAAAAVACLVLAGGLVGSRTPEPQGEVPVTSSTTGAQTYSASALRQAAAGPRLVLDAPGWTLQDLEGSSMSWHSGPADRTVQVEGGADRVGRGKNLEISWYPAASYEGYREDRSHVSAVQEIPVLGVVGRMVTYEHGDYAVMLPPAHGIFVEIRSSGLADEAAYRTLLTQLRQVSARAWLESLPNTVVIPCTGCSEVPRMLIGIPLPPGFDVAAAAPKAAEDYYQTGAHVTGAVACAWLESWTKAVATGDAVARDRAVAAMATSRQWAVLKRMNPEGDYPEVVWEYADQIAHGDAPQGFRSGLGCGSS